MPRRFRSSPRRDGATAAVLVTLGYCLAFVAMTATGQHLDVVHAFVQILVQSAYVGLFVGLVSWVVRKAW